MEVLGDVELYFKDLDSCHKKLTAEESAALYEDAKEVIDARRTNKSLKGKVDSNGNPFPIVKPSAKSIKAYDLLVASVLPYAAGIARKFRNKHAEYADLIGEANIWVLRALDKWEPSRGALTTLIGTAVPRGMIRDMDQHHNGVRVPYTTLSDIKECKADLGKLSAVEIAEKTGRSLERVHDICQAHRSLEIRSLSDPLPDGEEIGSIALPIYDSEIQEKLFDSKSLQKLLLKKLRRRNRDIINRLYGFGEYTEPQSSYKVAEECGITYQRVRQIAKAALVKLKPAIKHSLASIKGHAKFAKMSKTQFPYYRMCAGNCGRAIEITRKNASVRYCKICPRVKDIKKVGQKSCKGCGVVFNIDPNRCGQQLCSSECPSLTKSCTTCGESYIPKPHRPSQKLCSKCCEKRGKGLSPIVCGVCKKTFEPRSWKTKVCSHKCAIVVRAEANRTRAGRKPVECLHCKTLFKHRQKKVRYCSKKCVWAAKTKITQIECNYCKKVFLPTDAVGKYCSKECSHKGRRTISERPCEHCKTVFLPRVKKNKFCSFKCAIDFKTLPKAICKTCEREFHPRHSKAKFCSNTCAYAGRSKSKSSLAPVGTEVPLSECTEHCCVSAGA